MSSVERRRIFERVTIRALRGLRDLTLDGLGDVNVLVGDNDSGKTTVLEALLLLSEPSEAWRWNDAATLLRFGTWPRDVVAHLRSLLPKTHGEAIEIEVEGTFPITKLRATLQDAQRVSHAVRRHETGSAFDDGDEIERGVTAMLSFQRRDVSAPSQAVIQMFPSGGSGMGSLTTPRVPHVAFSSRPMPPQRVADAVGRARKEDRIGLLVELLRAIDDDVRDVALTEVNGPHYVEVARADGSWVPLSSYGDGVRRAAELALKLPEAEGGIVLIDELEAGFHPSSMPKLFAWLQRRARALNAQVFITTHSLEAVDQLLETDFDASELVVHRLVRIDGRVEARRFDEDLARYTRDTQELDLR